MSLPPQARLGSSREITRYFVNDLAALMPDRSIPLILIKENVCRMLEHKLTEDGFNMLIVAVSSTSLLAAGRRTFTDSLVRSKNLREFENIFHDLPSTSGLGSDEQIFGEK
jgi:hypothetical protein